MLKKLAVPFLTLAVATFGCSSTTTPTTGGGGAGGTSTGGAAGGAAGHASGGAAGGASGGAAGGASGGAAGGASGGAAGGASGGAAGGAAGHAAGGAGGTAAGGAAGGLEVDGGVIKVYQNVVMDAAMDIVRLRYGHWHGHRYPQRDHSERSASAERSAASRAPPRWPTSTDWRPAPGSQETRPSSSRCVTTNATSGTLTAQRYADAGGSHRHAGWLDAS